MMGVKNCIKTHIKSFLNHFRPKESYLLTEKEVTACFTFEHGENGLVWMVGDHRLDERFTFYDVTRFAYEITCQVNNGEENGGLPYLKQFVGTGIAYNLKANNVTINTDVPSEEVIKTYRSFYSKLLRSLWDNSAKDKRMTAIVERYKEFTNGLVRDADF